MSLSQTARRRRAEGRCTRCGEKLPKGYGYRDCQGCLAEHRRGPVSDLTKIAQRDERLATVLKTCKTMTSVQQASTLGVTVDHVRYLRCKARKLGYDVPREVGGMKAGVPFTAHESPRWRELDSLGACPRCSLRGPHTCLPSIYELAGSRRGPGRVMPEGGPSGMRVGTKR